jgi:hypothetical protein
MLVFLIECIAQKEIGFIRLVKVSSVRLIPKPILFV